VNGALRRASVWLVIFAVAMLAAFGAYLAVQQGSPAESAIGVDLLDHNKNDDKDDCPNDGNAGKGNDDKGPGGGCREHPPRGEYGNGNGNGRGNSGK
jgi:hypothetical protein